jgi:glycosyltransferase involved in cell wall biosynthesis
MIVSFTWPSTHHRTGGVVALYRFADALAGRGHEVHFIHGPAWPDRIRSIEELDWFQFDERIRHHVVDKMEEPGLPEADVVFTNVAPRRLGLPALVVQGARMLPEAVERAAFRLRGPKVCVAKWLIDVGRTYGVPEEQLWHVPMGIDHVLFAKRVPRDHRPYDVAMLHNPHPTKGWAVGWRALREAKRRLPRLRAVVFGVAEPSHPLGDWVDFRLSPDQQQLAGDVYNQARIFLQSSYQEGFGLTAVEAMACGATLVTTDNGGSRDYALPGETALVAPSGDAEGLAEAVVELIRNSEKRELLADAGERHVRRFEWSIAGETLEHHLEQFVADPARFQAEPGDDRRELRTW